MVRYSLLETLYMYMYMYMYMYRAVGIPSRDGDPDRVVASATKIGAEPSDPFYRRKIVFTHPEDGRGWRTWDEASCRLMYTAVCTSPSGRRTWTTHARTCVSFWLPRPPMSSMAGARAL